MASVAVSELRQKLMLLVELGVFPSHLDMAKKGFERSESTVYGWCTDDRTRRAGSMPRWAFEKLIDFYASLVPEMSRPSLQLFVQGPTFQLVSALRKDGGVSLMKTINDEAIREGRFLIRRSNANVIQLFGDEPDCDPQPISIGIPFRIEYPARHHCPYALAVQHVGASWGVFRPTLREGVVHIPGTSTTGELRYVVERVQRGYHRFICFQIAHPFPARLLGYADDRTTLDKQGLELLASFYCTQPRQHRFCQALTALIEDERA